MATSIFRVPALKTQRLGLQFECSLMLDVLVCAPGMLRRWDDSQKYLSDNPHLVCEETANCLVVICIDFEIDEVSAVRKVCALVLGKKTKQIWSVKAL